MTPLAPHSLSFRPLIIPIQTVIKIKKPKDNRNTAWVSLDGATRFELIDGEELIIKRSESNFEMVIEKTENMMDLWGKRLKSMLNWN